MNDIYPFVNIHCHNDDAGQAVSISNSFVQNRRELNPLGLYSLGLHPWNISDISSDFDLEGTLAYFIEKDKSLIAIGEIGIDRAIAIPIELQIFFFEQQLLVAQSYGLPVIIHCVRAYSEIIKCKKKLGITIPMIIHGYCGNMSITNELLKHGFLFSFGKQLLLSNKNAVLALTNLPYERLFFETDNENMPIEDIYKGAADLLKIDLFKLKEIVYENFNCNFRRFFC